MHVHIGRYYLLLQASTGGLGQWPHKQDSCTHKHSPGCLTVPCLLSLTSSLALCPWSSSLPPLRDLTLVSFALLPPSECPILHIFKTHKALIVAPVFLCNCTLTQAGQSLLTAPSSCPAPTIPKCLCCQLSHKSFS